MLQEIANCLLLGARYLVRPCADRSSSSSRSSLKKYILANNKNVSPGATFDGLFNRAVKTGVEKEEFAQPKGRSLFPYTIYTTAYAVAHLRSCDV